MSCPECFDAQTRITHVYRAGCRGCEARSLARAPDLIRDRFLATLPEPERTEMLELARAEWKREKTMEKAA